MSSCPHPCDKRRTPAVILASALSLAAALVLAGCSGEKVTGPSSDPGSGGGPGATPQFFNGLSEAAVSGATLEPSSPRTGERVTVRATGYFDRVCLFPSDGRLVLWPLPQAGGRLQDYEVRNLVYAADVSERRLRRWAPGTAFTITLSSTLAANFAVLDRVDEARGEIQRVTGMGVQVGSGGNIVMSVDPAAVGSDWARTFLDLSGDTIRSARIVFRSAELAASFSDTNDADTGLNTLLHEVGHALGLSDSNFAYDVMYQSWDSTNPNPRTFSDRELTAFHMMYQHRSAGNSYPDWDPAVPR